MTDAIIISGASGTGKTTLSQWLAPRLKAHVLNAGDVVLHTVLAHNLAPVSRADAGRLFMEHIGELALGPLLLQHLRPSERVIIDGLRLPFAKEFLQDRLGQIFHLHLDASNEVHQHRLLLRDGRIDVSDHAESFLPYLKQKADLVIADRKLGGLDHVSTFPRCSMDDYGDQFRVGRPVQFAIEFSSIQLELSEYRWRSSRSAGPTFKSHVGFAITAGRPSLPSASIRCEFAAQA